MALKLPLSAILNELALFDCTGELVEKELGDLLCIHFLVVSLALGGVLEAAENHWILIEGGIPG